MRAAITIVVLVVIAGLSPVAHAATLRGEWDFEDLEDFGLDSSGNDRHGIVEGDPIQVSGRPLLPEGVAKALAFDGDDHLRIPDGGFSIDGLDELTVEAWVKVDQHTGRNIFRVQQPVELRSDGFSIRDQAGVWHTVIANTQPPLGEWYHIAGVFERGEMRVYVNGRLANVETLETENVVADVSYTEWAIGARIPGASGPDQYFVGTLDLVRVYDRALPAADILLRAHETVLTGVIDVKTSGAQGDGVTDDQPAIQAALDAAGAIGAEVHIPSGIYRLGKLLIVPGSVLIRGDQDTVLKPLDGSGDLASPIFLLDDVEEVTIRDLQLDGFASGLVQSSAHGGIRISGSRVVHVDNVVVHDLGRSQESPGGANVVIEAHEVGAAPVTVKGEELERGVPSERNVIENCRLDDRHHITSFGIRLWTNWLELPPTGSFTGLVRKNVIKNNHLIGFYWNAIEIAGPATGFNRIDGNTVSDPLLVGIEADKGASDNLFQNNWIRRVSFHKNWTVTAMRDQGWANAEAGLEFWAERNVYFRNTISNVRSTTVAAGIYLNRSRDATVTENTFRDIGRATPAKTAAIVQQNGLVEGLVHADNCISAVANEITVID